MPFTYIVLHIDHVATGDLSEDEFELVPESVLKLSVKLSLPGISLSLVSGKPTEIFHAWLDTITVEAESGTLENTLLLEVLGCQVDSQLHNKVYDTVLWGRADGSKPVFHVAINMGLTSAR